MNNTITKFSLRWVPFALQLLLRWVCWRAVVKGDRIEKIPVNPSTGGPASSTDSSTWTVCATAAGYAEKHDLGIGFVLVKGSGMVGIDLDHCRDPDTGEIEAWALAIVRELDSYTEISPSGTGLHILVHGELPAGRRRKERVEAYDDGRYLTVTGNRLPGTPPAVMERNEEVQEFHAKYLADPEPPPVHEPRRDSPPVCLEDEAVLQKCRSAKNAGKFEALWRGGWSAYPSQSEADLALLGILAFYTQNHVQLDRLFRQSELMRPKWDVRHGAQTYGEITINTALARVGEVYAPGVGHPDPAAPVPLVEMHPGSSDWPTLGNDALHGLAGDIVRAIEPHTESDPAAILVQFLVGYGNCLDRAPHFRAEADQHCMNLNAVLVGATAKGRKGTSLGNVKRLLKRADPDWADSRILNGLSSGEGLIWAVRDEITKDEVIREKNRPTGKIQTVIVDQGITDKRLLVVESEFGGTLRVMARDGNTLSAVVRQAWDSGDLRTMTKNSPAQATGAHISILAHITKDELCRLLDTTEASNGFCNRFLWVCVKRSKVLPEGGNLSDSDLDVLAHRLTQAVQFGRGVGEIKRDEAARTQWCAVYPALSEGKPGLLGGVVSRAEAQVMRLACLYALLDRSYVVTGVHLRAALALWEYCEDSARYIFGQRLGDPVADELLSALRNHPEGMTRTEIRDLFQRNRKTHEINRGLTLLAKQGLARQDDCRANGRPVERWFAVGCTNDIRP